MRNRPGYSLIEIMFSASILAVLVAAAGSAMISTSRRDMMTREDGAAAFAARGMIAEVRKLTIQQAFETYDEDNRHFLVKLLNGNPVGSMGLVVNGIREPEGEIIFITSERPNEADYGRDLSPFDGQPDGVDLNGNGTFTDVLNVAQADGGRSIFPMDLNGNGTTTDVDITPANLQLLPVVVVVRWRSKATGEERRIQMMTVIGRQ
jgi:prepilin-type N-terminal cleavage/methylation domain-containing protein